MPRAMRRIAPCRATVCVLWCVWGGGGVVVDTGTGCFAGSNLTWSGGRGVASFHLSALPPPPRYLTRPDMSDRPTRAENKCQARVSAIRIQSSNTLAGRQSSCCVATCRVVCGRSLTRSFHVLPGHPTVSVASV